MVTAKTTRTRGVWRNEAAFERLTAELHVPAEVLERGMAAVIEWMNRSMEEERAAAVVAVLLAALSGADAHPPELKLGIRDCCELRQRQSWAGSLWKMLNPLSIIDSMLDAGDGAVLNDALVLRRPDGLIRVPTSLIDKLTQVAGNDFLVELLDGGVLQGALETSPVLFKRHGHVHRLRPQDIDHVHCVPNYAQEAMRKLGAR